MRDQHKAPSNTDRQHAVAKGNAANAMRDPASTELRAQAAKKGNDAHTATVSTGDQKRDEILHWIAHRLAQAQVLQQRELDQIAKSRVWYDEVAHKKGSFALPDPTRWKHCAKLYQQAIQAMTAGHLGRGAQLLDQAVEAERAVYQSLPAQVKRDDQHHAPAGTPEARMGISSGASCGMSHAQEMSGLAREIGEVTEHAGDVAQPQRNRPHHGWWGAAEGSEAKAAEKKPSAKKKGAPAVHAAEKPHVKAVAKAAPHGEAPHKAVAKAAPHVDTPKKAAPHKATPQKAEAGKDDHHSDVHTNAAKAPKAGHTGAEHQEPHAAPANDSKERQAEEQHKHDTFRRITARLPLKRPSGKGSPHG